MKGVIDTQLQQFSDQIMVSTTPEGIRIDLIDKDGNPLFPVAVAILIETVKRF